MTAAAVHKDKHYLKTQQIIVLRFLKILLPLEFFVIQYPFVSVLIQPVFLAFLFVKLILRALSLTISKFNKASRRATPQLREEGLGVD